MILKEVEGLQCQPTICKKMFSKARLYVQILGIGKVYYWDSNLGEYPCIRFIWGMDQINYTFRGDNQI